MSSGEQLPSLHNVHTVQPTRLVGIELTDPAPFADALLALGVPEAEVSKWRIYNNPADNSEPGGPVLSLDPRHINREMSSHAGWRDERSRNWRFLEAFHEVAPRVILYEAAYRVAESRQSERGFLYRNAEVIATINQWVGGTVLGVYIASVEQPLPPIVGLVEGLLASSVLSVAIRYAGSTRRAAHKLLRQVRGKDTALYDRLAGAITPKYGDF